MPENQTNYNIVTLKNIDDEDFIFSVNKVQYVIPAGKSRRFPKFMATLAYKHLVDKLLLKEDPEGTLLGNQGKRDEVGTKILISEETYEQPEVPTDGQIVEEMNKPSDIDRLLEKNKRVLKKEEPPVATTDKDIIIEKPEAPATAEEKFDGLEVDPTIEGESATGVTDATSELPSREEMMDYAENTLMLNVAHHMTKKRLAKLSDEELYAELQMGA